MIVLAAGDTASSSLLQRVSASLDMDVADRENSL